MKVIVISYRRPAYLERTLASLEQPGITTLVCDADPSPATRAIIERYAADAIYTTGRWTADAAKNAGINTFCQDDEYAVLSSDDYVYPPGLAKGIEGNWRALRPEGFGAICLSYHWGLAIEDHWWTSVAGRAVFPTDALANCALSVDLQALRDIGGYPVIGLTGGGDYVIGKALQQVGLRGCYVRLPSAEHIGDTRKQDYPEYSAEFEQGDADCWRIMAAEGWS